MGNTLLHCIRRELPVAGPVGGRLGQALRSDAYVGFREGPLTLVNIAEVSGQLKVALPTLPIHTHREPDASSLYNSYLPLI